MLGFLTFSPHCAPLCATWPLIIAIQRPTSSPKSHAHPQLAANASSARFGATGDDVPMRREPKHKVSRRFGVDIYGTGGASLQRRLERRPGARPGGRPRRRSEYGTQLQEKQKAKAFYGVAEGQFRRYFAEAEQRTGNTGENLLALLERRLDNVVYRLGVARTRPMARQLVAHGHVLVDGERVTIPSFRVDEGQTISLTDDARKIPVVIEETDSGRPLPGWLERGASKFEARITRLPQRDDVELPIDERLIISFYAR
jgi:small subunit ribosomal protein S4